MTPVNEISVSDRKTDSAIWNFAKNNDYTVITFDEDFVELQNLLGYPPKIIWLRMGNVTTQQIASSLNKIKGEIFNFIQDQDSGVFEIY